MARQPTHIKPTCPRCGYDQSGEAASWTDRCPLRGQCPECGTGFAWSDLFDPARQSLPWLVEHTRSIRGRARRTVPTLLCLALPWRFWTRVNVQSRTDARATAGWLLMLLTVLQLICWLPLSLVLAAADLGYSLSYTNSYTKLVSLIRDMDGFEFMIWFATGFMWPVASISYDGWVWGDDFGDGVVLISALRIPLGISLTWFAILFAVPVTRRIAMLRTAHLKRAVLFQFSGLIIVFGAMRILYAFALHAAMRPWAEATMVFLYLAVCIWTLAWWICAAVIGWNIRSWPLLVLTTLTSLLGGVVLYVIEASVSNMLRFYF